MANYSPQHFEPRAKTVNVKGVANRAVATVLTAGLIAQPLMSPLAAIAAPAGGSTDAVKGENPIESTVVAGNQAVAKTAAQLAEESAKQFEAAKAAYDAAQKKADAAGQAQKQAQQQKDQASQAVTDNATEQNAAEVAALREKIDELKAAVDKAEQQQKKLGDLNGQLDQAKKSVEDKTQALADAKAKQSEAEKTLKDAQAKLEAMGMGKYEAAKKDVEDAQAKLDAANADVKTAKGELDAATTAVSNAEQAKSDAESALTSAQAKKQETAAVLATATTAQANAQKKLDQAQAALDAATSGTGVDLKALEAAKVAAAGELKAAQAELAAATTADATAQANLQTAQAAVTAAQEKANAANAAVSSAQTAYDEANGKLGDLTNKYNTAKAAYDQAQQTVADKKAAYDQAVKDRDDKRAEYKAACDAADAAEAASDAASAEVDKLEQQIAELKSNMTVDQDIINNGMLGFMAYISNSSDFTAQQKANASAASSMLTGAPNTNQRYDKASWYDSYVDQDMSRDTNPLSLEQLRNALTYLDTQNNIRKANGQSELSVSLRMTAAAALNASYSSNIWGHSDHYFDNAENLAGGGGVYMGGETVDTLGWPYTGLYTQEKKIFDKYVEQYGDEFGSHRYDSYYFYQNYNSIYHECGHYLNIIDSDMTAIGIATGSGKNTDSEVTIFDYSADDTQADFTVSKFKKLVNDYIDSAYSAGGTQAQKQQLKELQGKLADAQKKFGTASGAYNDALNKQFDAQEALRLPART